MEETLQQTNTQISEMRVKIKYLEDAVYRRKGSKRRTKRNTNHQQEGTEEEEDVVEVDTSPVRKITAHANNSSFNTPP